MRRLVLLALPLLLVACQDNAANAEPQEAAHDKKAEAAHHDDHAGHGAASQPAGKKTALGNGETPAERNQVDADGVVRRGTALPKEAKLVSVADCVADAEKLAGKEVKVSGKVAQVCAAKGCWWSIENPADSTQRIRVTHKDYGFFVPQDAKGKEAVAYGVLEVKHMSAAEAEHMAKDEGKKNIDVAKLPKVELRLLASSLEMKKPAS